MRKGEGKLKLMKMKISLSAPESADPSLKSSSKSIRKSLIPSLNPAMKMGLHPNTSPGIIPFEILFVCLFIFFQNKFSASVIVVLYLYYRHIVNRIMNLHAPEWSGEVRSITYSADAKSVSVVYRVTLYGTDAEIFRESIGTASVDDTSYGDPVQKAEAMAFRRACARFGLGLHLYHEDLS
ncbi:PREDICTED: uncharacterized protein LOC101314142 isoform 1 [Fragaria vesca subsp. vesca]